MKAISIKSAVLIFFLIVFSDTIYAQQLPQSSFFNEGRAFWNPAYTGHDDVMAIDARVRQQWIGFGSNAPRNINLDVQYPFVDYNMAIGAAILYDQTGPVSKAGFTLNYAYSLVEVGGSEGRLSFGINAGGSQYSFDPSKEISRDPGDPLLESGSQTGFFPIVGAGAFYITSTETYSENSAFYIGLSGGQAYSADVLTDELNQKRQLHGVIDIGAKFYGYNSYIEPYFSTNYTQPDVLHSLFGLKYEMKDTFWGGLGYASSGDLAVQAGYIMAGINGEDSRLKIGALGNIPMSSGLSDFGPTAEIFFRYEYDQR